MCCYFNCFAYHDVSANIRVADNVLYLAISDDTSDVHLTFNPNQIYSLIQNLQIALTNIPVANLVNEKHFGNLDVQLVCDSKNESYEDLPVAVSF